MSGAIANSQLRRFSYIAMVALQFILFSLGAAFGGSAPSAAVVPSPNAGMQMLQQMVKLRDRPGETSQWLEDWLRSIEITIPQQTLKPGRGLTPGKIQRTAGPFT